MYNFPTSDSLKGYAILVWPSPPPHFFLTLVCYSDFAGATGQKVDSFHHATARNSSIGGSRGDSSIIINFTPSVVRFVVVCRFSFLEAGSGLCASENERNLYHGNTF